MRVVKLAEYRSRDVIEAARELLKAAEAGQIHGIAFVVKVAPGDSRAGIAGDYKRHSAEALQATFALERMLREPLESIG